jgi:sulfate adenylyltransferase
MTSPPHGGRLVAVSRLEPSEEVRRELAEAPSIRISDETVVTVRNIANGVYSPLSGFMCENDYRNVLEDMRLSDDTAWTIPILLHVPEGQKAGAGDEMTLVDEENRPVAQLEVEESYRISKKEYAEKVFGTRDDSHPGVAKLYASSERVLAGRLRSVVAYVGPFEEITLYPRETRVLFKERGWRDIIAFQTRNAPHIGHEYVQKTGLAFADGLFINPVIGRKKKGDFKDEVIVASYRALVENYYPKDSVVLSVLHYEMQYAGPKEAIMHAIMRKNFGCTHIAIGRDHAGVGNYYGPYAAHDIFREFPDLGIQPVFMREFFYCKKCMGMANERICPHGEGSRLAFSGTKLREIFLSGRVPPKEFMRPEVSKTILRFRSPFVE